MKLIVSDLKPLVLPIYPVVAFGGMLQLYSFWAVSRMFTTAIPEPTSVQLFMAALIYPLFLTAFFRVDGEKFAFQFSTVVFISAILGLVVFPMLAMLLSVVIPNFSSANGIFNVVVLLFDFAAAAFFLFSLSETDLHKIPGSLIWGSLLVFQFCAFVFILWNYGVIQSWYHFIELKLGLVKA